MEHILSLSYGKDSLACLGAIEQLGWPLDRIVHAEVWATDTIQADLPPMVEFKVKADKIILERWGIEVEHIFAEKSGEKWTYEKNFYMSVKPENLQKRLACKNWFNRGISNIYGFPSRKGPWCNKLKFRGSIGWTESNTYAGIAADEAERIERWKGKLDDAACRNRVDGRHVSPMVRGKRPSFSNLHNCYPGRVLVLP